MYLLCIAGILMWHLTPDISVAVPGRTGTNVRIALRGGIIPVMFAATTFAWLLLGVTTSERCYLIASALTLSVTARFLSFKHVFAISSGAPIPVGLIAGWLSHVFIDYDTRQLAASCSVAIIAVVVGSDVAILVRLTGENRVYVIGARGIKDGISVAGIVGFVSTFALQTLPK